MPYRYGKSKSHKRPRLAAVHAELKALKRKHARDVSTTNDVTIWHASKDFARRLPAPYVDTFGIDQVPDVFYRDVLLTEQYDWLYTTAQSFGDASLTFCPDFQAMNLLDSLRPIPQAHWKANWMDAGVCKLRTKYDFERVCKGTFTIELDDIRINPADMYVGVKLLQTRNLKRAVTWAAAHGVHYPSDSKQAASWGDRTQSPSTRQLQMFGKPSSWMMPEDWLGYYMNRPGAFGKGEGHAHSSNQFITEKGGKYWNVRKFPESTTELLTYTRDHDITQPQPTAAEGDNNPWNPVEASPGDLFSVGRRHHLKMSTNYSMGFKIRDSPPQLAEDALTDIVNPEQLKIPKLHPPGQSMAESTPTESDSKYKRWYDTDEPPFADYSVAQDIPQLMNMDADHMALNYPTWQQVDKHPRNALLQPVLFLAKWKNTDEISGVTTDSKGIKNLGNRDVKEGHHLCRVKVNYKYTIKFTKPTKRYSQRFTNFGMNSGAMMDYGMALSQGIPARAAMDKLVPGQLNLLDLSNVQADPDVTELDHEGWESRYVQKRIMADQVYDDPSGSNDLEDHYPFGTPAAYIAAGGIQSFPDTDATVYLSALDREQDNATDGGLHAGIQALTDATEVLPVVRIDKPDLV